MCWVGGSFSSPSRTQLCLGMENILLGRWGPLRRIECYFSIDSKHISHGPIVLACSVVTGSKGLQLRTLSLNIIFWGTKRSLGRFLLAGGTRAPLPGAPRKPLWVWPLTVLSLLTHWFICPLPKAWQIRPPCENPTFWGSSANASLGIFSYFICLFIRSLCGLSASWWGIYSPLQETL